MNRKNVIIILIDGGRLDRAQNSSIFDTLKNKSAFFSSSITYAPHTIAAMHAIFSGTYGIRTGTNSYWSTYEFKKDKFKTITEYLKENNYHTCSDVHSEIVIPKQGFDEFKIHDPHNDDLTQHHSELLEQMKIKNDSNTNFFLYLQYSNLHTTISDEVLKVYDNYSKEYFENRKLNEERYDREFKKAEDYLTNILEKINSLELDKNSLVLIMSDHGVSVGERFGERAYGAFCYDYTIKTFAYIIHPGVNPIEITQQVRTIDFMPTILDYLKIEQDKNYENPDGESLLPLINGKLLKEKIAYSETGNPLDDNKPPKEPNTKSVRTSKWKLIINEYNNTQELYDLENDPDEKDNVIGKYTDIEKMLLNEFLRIQTKGTVK